MNDLLHAKQNLILARSPRFQGLLERSRQSIQAGKGLSRDEFWQAVAERDQQAGRAKRAASGQ